MILAKTDNPHFKKDLETGAVVAGDNNEWLAYKARRDQSRLIQNLRDEVSMLMVEVAELKAELDRLIKLLKV